MTEPQDEPITKDWTTRQQARASNPLASAWVSANAGSGKTHVLSQRVIRLLLNGAAPSTILCLTYTKAAASEMANRVFERLAAWTRMDDKALAAALTALDGEAPGAQRMKRARQLFALALETPGGLKIQTIHAFCEAVLHQFPLEANVAGHFSVMDDGDTATLIAEAKRILLTATSAEDDKALAAAFETVLNAAGEDGLAGLLDDLVAKRGAVNDFVRAARSHGGVRAVLMRACGLETDITASKIRADVWPLPSLPPDVIALYAESASNASAATPKKYANALRDAAGESDAERRFAVLSELFLTKAGAPSKLGKAGAGNANGMVPDIQDRIDAASVHFLDALDRLSMLRMVEASEAAMQLAARLTEDYERLKRQRGKLDFDDLISRMADLLVRSGAGPWVHYKLDQGIDHILIDEAQDTSPPQWTIVDRLAGEFFAGEDSVRARRTLFAVGDEKQSIYSFQGARPERFRQEGRTFASQARDMNAPFEDVELKLSFRSTRDVLGAVDEVFADDDARRGLGESAVIHGSVRDREPGRVDLWEMIGREPRADDGDWTAPFDETPESDPKSVLARRIAAEIRRMIDHGERVEKGVRRAIAPGDILVLVRKRDGFVNALNRALKQSPAVPVAGADRLVLTDHIAVKDLMALGRVVTMPDDDLSLAALLKSPLFSDVDEDALFKLCHQRRGDEGVHDALKARSEAGEAPFAAAFQALQDYRVRAMELKVFDFYSEVLGPLQGRRAFLARLGSEAADVLDAFVEFALDHEQSGLPGLQSFLAVLEDQSPVIKREMDKDRDEVRIMTVHASKGLEAPIVFLVDSGGEAVRAQQLAKLRSLHVGELSDPAMIWVANKHHENSVSERVKAELARAGEEEYRRLLYVGMTRAADRLIVCGYHGLREPTGPHWQAMVRNAFERHTSAREETWSDGISQWKGLRFELSPPDAVPATDDAAPVRAQNGAGPDAAMPLHPLPAATRPPRPLAPSGTHAIIDGREPVSEAPSPFARSADGLSVSADSLVRGRIMHRFLEVLPAIGVDERRQAGERYLQRAQPGWSANERGVLVDQALAILDHPAFAPVFAPSSRAEVSLMGTLTLGGTTHTVSGRIDRLAALEDRVLLVDFKTNRRPPLTLGSVPDPYIAQMALYRALLAPVYPDRRIEAALVFTEAPVLITLSDDVLDRALADITTK